MLVCNCTLPPSCCKNCSNYKRAYGEPLIGQCPYCGQSLAPPHTCFPELPKDYTEKMKEFFDKYGTKV